MAMMGMRKWGCGVIVYDCRRERKFAPCSGCISIGEAHRQKSHPRLSRPRMTVSHERKMRRLRLISNLKTHPHTNGTTQMAPWPRPVKSGLSRPAVWASKGCANSFDPRHRYGVHCFDKLEISVQHPYNDNSRRYCKHSSFILGGSP